MKNIVNYLDEFIEDDLNECCNKKIKKNINKKKPHKMQLNEDNEQNFTYNKKVKYSKRYDTKK